MYYIDELNVTNDNKIDVVVKKSIGLAKNKNISKISFISVDATRRKELKQKIDGILNLGSTAKEINDSSSFVYNNISILFYLQGSLQKQSYLLGSSIFVFMFSNPKEIDNAVNVLPNGAEIVYLVNGSSQDELDSFLNVHSSAIRL